MRVNALQHLGAKRGDWVAILPGPGNTIVIKRINKISFDYDAPPDKGDG